MSDPAIRPAALADAEAIGTLAGQLGYPATRADTTLRLGAILARADHGLFVAEADEHIIGWVHVVGVERVTSDAHALVAALVVSEDHRGEGVGAALLEAAEGWGREQGYRAIRVRSNVAREEAHRFYEKQGYKSQKQQAVFLKQLG